jgi:hypothetical protein
MFRATLLVVVLMLVPIWYGCAGTKSDRASDSYEYSADIGMATDFDTMDKTRRLLSRFQYQLIREERTADEFYFETGWKDRQPFADEREVGIVAARTRIIIRARPRGRVGTGLAKLNRIRFFAENEVLFGGTGEWMRAPMSGMLTAYLKELVNDFKTEFRAGIRKFE